MSDLEFNIATELSTSTTTIKCNLESFRKLIQTELQKELETNTANTIQSTTSQLTRMITKEVNRALQTQIQVLSPHNRKPKQSRAPNIDDPISQRLFTYELANQLFEANMTVRPNSSNQYTSDTEDSNIHHP